MSNDPEQPDLLGPGGTSSLNGSLLEFSIRENRGLILGDNGRRYRFPRSEWKPGEPPRPGMRPGPRTRRTRVREGRLRRTERPVSRSPQVEWALGGVKLKDIFFDSQSYLSSERLSRKATFCTVSCLVSRPRPAWEKSLVVVGGLLVLELVYVRAMEGSDETKNDIAAGWPVRSTRHTLWNELNTFAPTTA